MFKNKAKYKIAYTGLFCHGYVKAWVFIKPKNVNNTDYTVFYFRFMAEFWCYLMNKNSKYNFELMEFKVVKF